MPLYSLTIRQVQTIGEHVDGQSVIDLGAGDLAGAHMLAALGASEIFAVDRRAMPTPDTDRIVRWMGYFQDVKERRPVVFASWIPTNTDGVVPILADAKTIVSISKNTDGVACGYREMWAHLRGREILAYLPRPANVVTIYGSKAVRRGPTGDELAALERDIWTYDRAELEAARIFADATVEAG